MSFERDGSRPMPLEALNVYPALFGGPPIEDFPPMMSAATAAHPSSRRHGNRRVTIDSVWGGDEIDRHLRGFSLFRPSRNGEEDNRNMNSERSPPHHSRGTPSDRQQAKAVFASHDNETHDDGKPEASSGNSLGPTNAGTILGNSDESNQHVVPTIGTDGTNDGTPPGLREYQQKRHAEFLQNKAIMLDEDNGDLRRLLNDSRHKSASLERDLMDESDRNSWLAQELRKEKQYSSDLEYRLELLQNKSNDSHCEALPSVDPSVLVHHRHEMPGTPVYQQDPEPVPNNVVVATESNPTQVTIEDLAVKLQTLEDELAASKSKKRKRSRSASKKKRQSKTHNTDQDESSKQSFCIIM